MRRPLILQSGLLIASVSAAALGLLAAVLGAGAFAVVAANAIAVATGLAALSRQPEDNDQSGLIAEVSHELRTPLTGILGTLELLTESTIPLEASEVDELLITAHSEADHLLHIVGNLHARSRLDRSILTPETRATDVRAIVERAISRSPQVARRCFLSPGDGAVATADPQLVMQIVTNLVQNIQRYAPDGEVHITFAADQQDLAVTFEDSGPGVATFRAERIFTDAASTEGLGLGLALSRQLARAMDGDLTLEVPGKPGARFVLRLPVSDEKLPSNTSSEIIPGDRAQAHSPRARLLVDLADAFDGQSLELVVGGIQKIYADLLGATGAVLLVTRRDGSFYSAGTYEETQQVSAESASDLQQIVAHGKSLQIADIADTSWAPEAVLGGHAAMLLPVHDSDRVVAVLAVGWKSADMLPTGSAVHVAEALAQLTASAIARTALTRDVAFERRLRASVMDELPIAVSVFAGDPPEVVDWNRKERQLLGIEDDSMRPHDLAQSQHEFNVRFADGTPLTVENAPVTTAIRSGKATGPFILLIERADGGQVHTRTYCAPFFDSDGVVAGAVVTSEALDLDSPN
ncbi:MAG: GAF domain-containing protein [bacterium]|nr:GAF domain-containing protein [bacterium]